MLNNRAATIKDVARLAEVSTATVSAVMNGTAKVSPTRTRRVREAMEALDYHPDQVARSFRTRHTHVIGMIIPDVSNAFYPEVIRGVEDVARQANYSVILCNSNEDPEQERRLIDTLWSRRVDGLLIACSDSSTSYERVLRRLPVVFFDRIPQGLKTDAVHTDNFEASYKATRYLIELGHERIAILVGKLNVSPHANRLEGFRKAMQERGLAIREDYLRVGLMSAPKGYEFGTEILRLPAPPTAVFSTNNELLPGLMRAIRDLGIACPEQLSVMGFDDNAWTQNFSPALSTVAQPTFELGRTAMRKLLERMAGHAEGSVAVLASELRIRQSTTMPVTQSEPALSTHF